MLKNGEVNPAEWWIPGAEENKIDGVCEITQDGRIIPRLHRNPFRPKDSASLMLEPFENIPLVHGKVFGTPVTLIDCRVIPRKSGLTPHAVIELQPWIALEGLLLDTDDLMVSKAEVRLRGQREWASWEAWKHGDRSSGLKSLIYSPPEPRPTSIPGGTLTIDDSSTFRSQNGEISVKSQCKFVVQLDSPIDIREFLPRYIYPLEVLMSLTIASMAPIEHLGVASDHWESATLAQLRPNWLPVRFGRSGPRNEKTRINADDVLFYLNDCRWEELGERIYTVIPQWEYVIAQWSTLIDKQYRWPVPRFLTAVTAIEAVDRILHPDEQSDRAAEYREIADEVDTALRSIKRLNSKRRARIKNLIATAYEPSLEDRLKRLSDRVESGMADLNLPDHWTNRVARLRNQVSHGLSAAHYLATDHRAAQVGEAILLHLLESLFLHELGLNPEELGKVMERRFRLRGRISVIAQGFGSLLN
jgi:hypothetical protein